jgi:hypothetical protein
MTPTGYLDTNLVSGLVKEDLGDVELPALIELLRLREQGAIALCTSHITAEELSKIPAEVRGGHDDIYMRFDDVPAIDERFRMPMVIRGGPGTRIIGPPVVADAALYQLRSILPDETDARHVFQAARNGVDYFVTCDDRTIVRHVAAVQEAVGIVVCLPSQLVAELTAATS